MSETTSQPAVPSPAEPVPNEFDLLCEQCGYSLVGLIDSNRCPECGKEFDANQLPLARVPWLYRVRLGKARAYWRTVRYVLANPTGFATELCRPVRISVLDAAAFRKWTVRIACASVMLPIAILMGTVVIYNARAAFVMTQSTGFLVEIVSVSLMVFGILTFAVWLLFTVGTDLPTFIWKGMGDRANELAPVHHYAAAPLAIIPFFIPFIVGAGIAEVMFTRSDDFVWAQICLAAAALVQLVIIGGTAAALMRGATKCGRGRQARLLGYLIFHWLMMVSTCFLGTIAMIAGVFYLMHKIAS